MTTNRALSVAALLLAGAALLTAVMNRSGSSHQNRSEATADSDKTLAARFEQLQRDHQALQESQRQLQEKLARFELAKAPTTADTDELTRIKQRLEELDAQQTQFTKFTRDFDQYGVISAMEREVVDAYATLMDTNQTVGARVKQAEKLKRLGQLDDKAAKAMTDLYGATTDLKEKAGVMQALTGVVVTPEFRDLILQDLNQEIQDGNQQARFRYYAIEALEPMLPDPVVEEWLSYLAEADPEPKLAARAGRPLGIAPPPPVKK